MKFILLSILFVFSAHAQTLRVKKPNYSSEHKQIEKDLNAISKTNLTTKPTVWLTPERARELNRVTSRSYITKIERNGDMNIYHWTNGLHGAITTQRVDRLVNKPARDARREQLEKTKSDAEKFRKERDSLKSENENLKKGQQKK